jgi:regulator of protease activity HflC (stomatin/prohibitin superfamily)
MEFTQLAVILAVLVVVTLYKGINIVPQGEEWLVERLGKFSRVLKPGLNIIIPYIEAVRQKITTRDIILDIPPTRGYY